MRDARGDPQFIGENRIDHTPMGSAMSLRTGDAFDVKVQPTVVSRTRKGGSRWVTKMRYTVRSEEHTSELQSLMRISYAVFCLKKKTKTKYTITQEHKVQQNERIEYRTKTIRDKSI